MSNTGSIPPNKAYYLEPAFNANELELSSSSNLYSNKENSNINADSIIHLSQIPPGTQTYFEGKSQKKFFLPRVYARDFNNLDDKELKNTPSWTLNMLEDDEINKLDARVINGLENLRELSTRFMSNLPNSTLTKLQPRVFNSLSNWVFNGLNIRILSSIPYQSIRNLTMEEINNLPAQAIKHIIAPELNKLSDKDIRALSENVINELSSETINNLEERFFNNLSNETLQRLDLRVGKGLSPTIIAYGINPEILDVMLYAFAHNTYDDTTNID